MFVIAFLLLLPALQLGTSYYVSVATLLLLIAMARGAGQLMFGLSRVWLLLLITAFMPLQFLTYPSLDTAGDFLRIVREAVMFAILLAATIGFRARPIEDKGHNKLILFLLVICFLMTLTQTFYYARGIYFGIPEAYFALESKTIADELTLRYIAENIRPHATFSEPSYLGFVLLSLSLMIVPRMGNSRLTIINLGLILVIGLLSRSLAFFLSFGVVIALPLIMERRGSRTSLALALAVVSLPAVALLAPQLIERLYDVGSSRTVDYSTTVRIIGPLSVLIPFLIYYPVGVPWSVVDRAIIPFAIESFVSGKELLDNGLFNVFFSYGIIGLALITSLLAFTKEWRVRAYLVACMLFSGSFFSIDKVAVICMTLALYEAAKRENLVAREKQLASQHPDSVDDDFDHDQRNLPRFEDAA